MNFKYYQGIFSDHNTRFGNENNIPSISNFDFLMDDEGTLDDGIIVIPDEKDDVTLVVKGRGKNMNIVHATLELSASIPTLKSVSCSSRICEKLPDVSYEEGLDYNIFEFRVNFDLSSVVLSLKSLIQTDDKSASSFFQLTLYNGFGYVSRSINIVTRENVAFIGYAGAGKSQLLESYKAYLNGTSPRVVKDGPGIAGPEKGVAFSHNGVTYFETMGFASADANHSIQTCRLLKKFPPQRIVIVLQYGCKTPDEGLPTVLKDIHGSVKESNPFLIVVTRLRNGPFLQSPELKSFVDDNIKTLSLPESTRAIFVNSLPNYNYGESFGMDELHAALKDMDRSRLIVSRTPLQRLNDFLELNKRTVRVVNIALTTISLPMVAEPLLAGAAAGAVAWIKLLKFSK
jgi:hypothetical protein